MSIASVLVLFPISHVVTIYLFLALRVIWPFDHAFGISGEITIFDEDVI